MMSATPRSAAQFKVVFIGSGVSTAVPNLNHILNGPCPVCLDAMNVGSKNRRNNVSVAIIFEHESADGAGGKREKCILIDIGKTMREACLRILPQHGIAEINAIFLTHGHADAVLGLDDVRDLQRSEPVTLPNPNMLSQPKTSPVDCQCCQPPLVGAAEPPAVADAGLFCQVCGGATTSAAEDFKGEEKKSDRQPPAAAAAAATVAVAAAAAKAPALTGFKVLSGSMPIYLHQETMDVVSRQFGYLTGAPEFLDEALGVLARRVALIQFTVIEQNANINIFGLSVRTFPVYHGGTYVSLGFDIGNGEFVYISDVKIIPEPTMMYLRSIPQINTLVLDALNRDGIYVHMGLEEALAVAADLKPKRVYFTGMACDMGFHADVEAELTRMSSDGIERHLAYDGLALDGFKM